MSSSPLSSRLNANPNQSPHHPFSSTSPHPTQSYVTVRQSSNNPSSYVLDPQRRSSYQGFTMNREDLQASKNLAMVHRLAEQQLKASSPTSPNTNGASPQM
jgi:hypothetical protein